MISVPHYKVMVIALEGFNKVSELQQKLKMAKQPWMIIRAKITAMFGVSSRIKGVGYKQFYYSRKVESDPIR